MEAQPQPLPRGRELRPVARWANDGTGAAPDLGKPATGPIPNNAARRRDRPRGSPVRKVAKPDVPGRLALDPAASVPRENRGGIRRFSVSVFPA